MKRFLPLIALFASALTAVAHPAQFHSQDLAGATQAGFLHPLTGLDHLLVMVAVGLWAVQIGGQALWLLPGAFVGSMILGGVVGLCGVHQPYVEHGILASMVLLGVSLGMAWRPTTRFAALCVGAAGLFHGYAHGSEIPYSTTPIMFLLGMVAATALLHVFGVGGGLLLNGNPKIAMGMRAAGLLLIAFAVYDFCFQA